jgi:hypothetical protein
MKHDFTIVVCTCDAYEDAWMPLFTLFQKYWDGMDYKIVLNTETKAYSHHGLDVYSPMIYKHVNAYENISWSKRLKDILLHHVNTEIVLIYLDDFYLQSPVNIDKLAQCVNLMKEDKTISNLQLFPCPPGYHVISDIPWLVKRKKGSPYYFNLQAGLWKTNRLVHFLRDHESPWYFERWGSVRALRYIDKVYCINPDFNHNLIFDYNPSMIGLSKGFWLPKTKEFFLKEKIDIDTQIRGSLQLGYKFPVKKRNYLKSLKDITKSLIP